MYSVERDIRLAAAGAAPLSSSLLLSLFGGRQLSGEAHLLFSSTETRRDFLEGDPLGDGRYLSAAAGQIVLLLFRGEGESGVPSLIGGNNAFFIR